MSGEDDGDDFDWLTILDDIFHFTSVTYVVCWTGLAWHKQKSTVTHRSKEAMATPEHAKKKFLDKYSHRNCRSVAGLRQFVSKMRYDATFATEEGMRDALNPIVGSLQKSWESRDTSKVHRDVLSFRWATEGTTTLTVMVDSGWVGCTRTRQLQAGCWRWEILRWKIGAWLKQRYRWVQQAPKQKQSRKDAWKTPAQKRKLEPHNLELWKDGSSVLAISQRFGPGRH